jgi:MFS family permease
MVWFSARMVLAGFWCLMFLTAANQMVQTSSNMSIRGRVMSLYIMVLIGGQAIGGPMIGWLAEHLGPHRAILVSGGVPAIAAVTSRRRTGPAKVPSRSRWTCGIGGVCCGSCRSRKRHKTKAPPVNRGRLCVAFFGSN